MTTRVVGDIDSRWPSHHSGEKKSVSEMSDDERRDTLVEIILGMTADRSVEDQETFLSFITDGLRKADRE